MNTWAMAASRWQRENKHRAEETIRREQRLIDFASERIGSVAVNKVRASHLSKLRNDALAASWGPRSCNYLTQTVRTIIRAAASWDWTRFDPPYIKPLPLPSGRTRWLTRSEAEDLLLALPSPISDMAALSLETGLRKANIRDLTWQWVNDEFLHVPGPSVKTRQDLIVPLSQRAKLIIEARSRSRFGDFVFHKHGRRIDRPAGYQWRSALDRLEIEDFHWHDLRHTWASWHVQAGTDLKVLKELGGWKTLAMVDRYAHLTMERKRAAARQLELWHASEAS